MVLWRKDKKRFMNTKCRNIRWVSHQSNIFLFLCFNCLSCWDQCDDLTRIWFGEKDAQMNLSDDWLLQNKGRVCWSKMKQTRADKYSSNINLSITLANVNLCGLGIHNVWYADILQVILADRQHDGAVVRLTAWKFLVWTHNPKTCRLIGDPKLLQTADLHTSLTGQICHNNFVVLKKYNSSSSHDWCHNYIYSIIHCIH